MRALLSFAAFGALLGWYAFAGSYLASGQTQAHPAREGSDWLETSSGVLTLCAGCRLRVLTEGNLVLKGEPGAGNAIHYTIKKRVRADSEADAERLLRSFEFHSSEQGGVVTLTLTAPRRQVQGADVSISVPRGAKAVLAETLGGDMDAAGLDGELQAATAAGRIELDRLGGNAIVKTGGGDIRIGLVSGGVRCYSAGGGIRVDHCGRESWFQTEGGDITVREAAGPVHASTAGGNIQVDHSDGEVFAHTAAGIIQVQRAAGLVTADTNGGAIQVGAAHGVRCQSTAGAIRLRNVDGGPLRALTGVGSILAELISSTRIQDSLLSTNSGDITVFISSNIPVTVQARNESAGGGRRIISDFPEIRIQSTGVNGPFPLIAEGALNGGGPVLRIFAASGTIYLRRQQK